MRNLSFDELAGSIGFILGLAFTTIILLVGSN